MNINWSSSDAATRLANCVSACIRRCTHFFFGMVKGFRLIPYCRVNHRTFIYISEPFKVLNATFLIQNPHVNIDVNEHRKSWFNGLGINSTLGILLWVYARQIHHDMWTHRGARIFSPLCSLWKGTQQERPYRSLGGHNKKNRWCCRQQNNTGNWRNEGTEERQRQGVCFLPNLYTTKNYNSHCSIWSQPFSTL